jgi:translation initiation factor IF-1
MGGIRFHSARKDDPMGLSDTSIGERFVRSLLAKDWSDVEDVMDPAIDFRGLTPDSAWEASSAKNLISSVFQVWFEPSDDIEIVAVSTDLISTRSRIVYRFRVRNEAGDYVCEQTAYYDETKGKIMNLRILCSGFLKIADHDR